MAVLYLVEALGSAGGTLLTIGIFFYTKDRFRWQMPQNFLLAAVQGAVYVVGALLAGKVSARLDRRGVFRQEGARRDQAERP